MAHKAIPINMSLSKVSRRILPSLSLNPSRAPMSSRYINNTVHILPIPTTQTYSKLHKLQQRRLHPLPQPQSRPFTTSPARLAAAKATAAEISLDQYHKISDEYIDKLVAQLEEMQEEREEVDVEYSAGVLTLLFPPHGTYVLNKQPPNKQIWLSSPVSGPKRYDWVVRAGDDGDGREDRKKNRKGEWVYLRDGSTLNGLLEEEVGVVAGEKEKEGEGEEL